MGHLLCLEGNALLNGRRRNIQFGETEYGFELYIDMVSTNTYSMILSDFVPLHKGKKSIVSHSLRISSDF